MAEHCVCFICNDAVHLQILFFSFFFLFSIFVFHPNPLFPLVLMDVAVFLNAKASSSSSFDVFECIFWISSKIKTGDALCCPRSCLVYWYCLSVAVCQGHQQRCKKIFFYLLPLALHLDVLYRNELYFRYFFQCDLFKRIKRLETIITFRN